MTKLVLAILLIFSVAAAPVPAFAAPLPDCAMTPNGSDAGDHGEMACCGPGCAVICPSAALPATGFEFPEVAAVSPPEVIAPGADLASSEPAGTDPPPRSTIS